MENACLSEVHPEGVLSDFENAKYVRGFLKVSDENELSENEIAAAIGEYIKVLDKCIKFYFEHLHDEELIEKNDSHFLWGIPQKWCVYSIRR